MIAHLSELIANAVSYIFGLKKHVADLTATVAAQAARVKELEATVFSSSAAIEANKATDAAATARIKDLEDQAALLDASGVELAAAITDHPEVPLAVDPDFTSVATPPADQPVMPVDEAPPVADETAAADGTTDEVDFAAGDVVTDKASKRKGK